MPSILISNHVGLNCLSSWTRARQCLAACGLEVVLHIVLKMGAQEVSTADNRFSTSRHPGPHQRVAGASPQFHQLASTTRWRQKTQARNLQFTLPAAKDRVSIHVPCYDLSLTGFSPESRSSTTRGHEAVSSPRRRRSITTPLGRKL